MSLFNKPNKPAVTPKPETERKPSEFFINIGFAKQYGDQQRFVNIPVVITADTIREGIERVQKACGVNSPDDWVEFTEDRMMLGEDIINLFSEIPEGNQIVNKDIPSDHELAYLQDLEVQFVHKDMHKAPAVVKPADVKERRAGFGRK